MKPSEIRVVLKREAGNGRILLGVRHMCVSVCVPVCRCTCVGVFLLSPGRLHFPLPVNWHLKTPSPTATRRRWTFRSQRTPSVSGASLGARGGPEARGQWPACPGGSRDVTLACTEDATHLQRLDLLWSLLTVSESRVLVLVCICSIWPCCPVTFNAPRLNRAHYGMAWLLGKSTWNISFLKTKLPGQKSSPLAPSMAWQED